MKIAPNLVGEVVKRLLPVLLLNRLLGTHYYHLSKESGPPVK